jgi:flagellar motility protein MotE (MotC chaperone)
MRNAKRPEMSEEQYTFLTRRQDKIEEAIEKLTDISSDLNKMIAVHEERINRQEKNVTYLEDVIEKRREESDIKLKDVYDTMRSEDTKILEELNKMRKEAAEQHMKLGERITTLENNMFMYVGGVSVIVFLLTYGPQLLKFFIK